LVEVVNLTDPTGRVLFKASMTPGDYLNQPIRYIGDVGTTTMLVSNAPATVSVTPGPYVFEVQSSAAAPPATHVYLKLGALSTGSVDLNLYVTDLSSACRPLTADDVKSGALQTMIDRIKSIFAQSTANITIGNVNVIASSAPNTIKLTNTDASDLYSLVRAATAGQSGAASFDVVLVRSITDASGASNGTLGAASGIPTSPVLGTPHSGVAVSIEASCTSPYNGSLTLLGSTAAHELGHSIGLFHNVEMDNSHDPLTDTAGDGQENLMYWLENSDVAHVTVQQGEVMRSDPKVKQ
jgi:hypothetical protein